MAKQKPKKTAVHGKDLTIGGLGLNQLGNIFFQVGLTVHQLDQCDYEDGEKASYKVSDQNKKFILFFYPQRLTIRFGVLNAEITENIAFGHKVEGINGSSIIFYQHNPSPS